MEGLVFENGTLQKKFEDESKPIGLGSFGIVTKVRHKVTGEFYAIKKLVVKSN